MTAAISPNPDEYEFCNGESKNSFECRYEPVVGVEVVTPDNGYDQENIAEDNTAPLDAVLSRWGRISSAVICNSRYD